MNKYQGNLILRIFLTASLIIIALGLTKFGLLDIAFATIIVVVFAALALCMICYIIWAIYKAVKTDWAMRKIIKTQEDYDLYKIYKTYPENKILGYYLFCLQLNLTETQQQKLDEFRKIDKEINGEDTY